jgi:hypothetical protein
MMVLFGEGYAAAPTVKLIVNPDTTNVYVGSEPISLTAEVTGSGLTFRWELRGPGKIEGKGPAISYIVPETMKKASARATITVTVTDEAAQETTETFTFTILAKEKSPKPAKKGMSRTTRIALGVGAAALLGGGIALFADGDDDDDDNGSPFTGTFRFEFTAQTDKGNPTSETRDLILIQNGISVSGTYVANSTLVGCCTASFAVPVTGRIAGNSVVLTWGAGKGTCWCSEWRYSFSENGGTYAFTLVDNGRILRSGGVDFIRLSVVSCPGTGPEVKDDSVIHFEGRDFIRQ